MIIMADAVSRVFRPLSQRVRARNKFSLGFCVGRIVREASLGHRNVGEFVIAAKCKALGNLQEPFADAGSLKIAQKYKRRQVFEPAKTIQRKLKRSQAILNRKTT